MYDGITVTFIQKNYLNFVFLFLWLLVKEYSQSISAIYQNSRDKTLHIPEISQLPLLLSEKQRFLLYEFNGHV
jgi:hypothetical protein